ncbi:MAG: presqualene diphosphate synthase HpnD [Candidatus Protistobacter heckmanni]|nr:presqualene diphosphate synthase HpnD [Candidatus Protistobacter heckmanni]
MTPDQYCESRATQSGSSFYYSFLFLPPERRRAITALYAFCSEVDDAVDEASDPSVAETKLAWWRQELAHLYAGQPDHPVTRALEPHLQTYGIERSLMQAVLDGVEMDLRQSRYLDFASLKTYCYRVAGAVGILSTGIFGHTDPQTLAYAEKLGEALQLINIIRDVGEDARQGRIYLPVDELQRFKVPASDIINARYTPEFTALMRFQAQRARDTHAQALALLPAQDRRAQRPGLMMGAIYLTLLREIEAEDMQVLHQRISLTPLRKLWVAWKTWAFGTTGVTSGGNSRS